MLTLSALVKDAKFVVTIVGIVLMLLNEILAVVPGASTQHWVTAVIAALTVLARDITDVLKATGNDAARKAASK